MVNYIINQTNLKNQIFLYKNNNNIKNLNKLKENLKLK